KFHTTQGLILFIFELILFAILNTITLLLVSFEVISELITLFSTIACLVIVFIMMIMGIFCAVKGKMVVLPFIGDITSREK
ncbi:MAG: hypothetical protein Q4B14_06285, partial [Clostridia bacterium]|nr:hypothetical protein [Clostridia bacterium]